MGKGKGLMSYTEAIQKCLRYIDDNLTNQLNIEKLANLAGFSTYHFQRVFSWHVGHSVMEYVRLRRLAFAATELANGRKIIDIAMDYGFETHSGFSKAFKRRYGASPESYRIHATASKPPLPDISYSDKYKMGGIVMEPKFVSLDAIKIAGYSIKTKNVEGENSKDIPSFWRRYFSDGLAERLHSSDFVKSHSEYGACLSMDTDTGEFFYVIGVEVNDGADIPEEFYVCEMPAATYAVFSSPPSNEDDFVKNIQGTWRFIMEEWFEVSGYEYAEGCADFELYGEKCMAETGKICEIYIPVVKK